MALKLIKPTPTTAQLKALAASGSKGCVKARRELSKRLHHQLEREVRA